ncbi:MAG: TonB-dependent receptor [Gammaproteobacteria bacterium]|nr:TonB-dependent receptor [Gammaproteobacteria bacterium]
MKIITPAPEPQRLSLHCLFAATLALACLSPAYALEPVTLAALSEEDFLADIPMVLTATRLAQPITEAPAAISIIDREMIRASGAREIVDLFRMVPGFVVSRDSGHSPIVTYHGLSTEYLARMQVLVDGRSVYSPVFGGVDWANLPLAMDDIERIEVIRGPNSASYGSNAFLSVINIITQHASATSGTFVRGTHGSNGARDATVRYGNTGGGFDYRITANINKDDGFEAREDDRNLKTARFRADYQASARDSVLFQAGATRGIREIDSKTLLTTEDRDININFEQIRWQRQIDNDDAVSLQFFHTLEDINEIFDVVLPPAVHIIRDSSTRAERFDLELQHTRQLEEKARLVWGLGLRQDAASGPHLFGTDPATGYTGSRKYFYNQVARGFSNVEWRLKPNLTLNLGAMLERSDLADYEFSPRLGLNYSFTPQQSIRLIASRATRTPTLTEARSNFRIPIENYPAPPFDFTTTIWVGNEDLNPEKITAYELGYHADLTRNKLSFDLKLFRENLHGLISLDENSIPNPADPLLGEYERYDNLTDAHIRGAEANLDFSPTPASRLILSRSLTDIKSENPNISSEKLDETAPRHITSILALHHFPSGISSSLLYYRVSESNGLGSGDPLPGYQHVNVRVGFPFRASGVSGELAFVVQNIGDGYIDWRSENVAETQQYVTVSAQLD